MALGFRNIGSILRGSTQSDDYGEQQPSPRGQDSAGTQSTPNTVLLFSR